MAFEYACKPMPRPPIASITTELHSGLLFGPDIVEIRRTVGDLAGYWHDPVVAEAQANELLYVTQSWFPVPESTAGALLWGNTTLMPGLVGDEFFMTRGHWHEKRDRGELCVTTSVEGLLVLMDESRVTRFERMVPGSTHYIPCHTAHRTVNTGTEPLVFLCAWPADCGHEYASILTEGFSERVRVGFKLT
jgi:glucose-6-phosphate isomerase